VTSLDGARAALDARVNAIEEAYEFFLAYASQGLPSDSAGGSGSQIRDYLGRCDRALNGLGACIMQFVQHLAIEPSPYRAYVNVVDRDALDASAGIQLVLAQPAIGSQLIDNLNASIHLRALLTDLFLVDEALKTAGSG